MNHFASIGYTLVFMAMVIYVGVRCYRILPWSRRIRVSLTALYGTAVLAYMLSLTGAVDILPMPVASVTYIFGNSWMIFFFYAFIIFVLMELLRLMEILPGRYMIHSAVGSAVVFGIIIAVMIWGAIQYRHKYREEITVTTAKIESPLKIVLMSDLHIGYHNRRATLARWVDMINGENPDLILIAGDIIDRSTRAIVADGDAAEFRRLKAPVYACLGNHEYYAGVEKSIEFYKDAGIHLLQDSSAVVCGITVIGRDDASDSLRCRPYLLARKTNPNTYRIMLDHRPDTLSEACLAKVDFQFSGHTHGGQIWPFSLLLKVENELSYGYMEKGDTRFYVTSGLGIWGGRFRIGTRSEYLVLYLKPESPGEELSGELQE